MLVSQCPELPDDGAFRQSGSVKDAVCVQHTGLSSIPDEMSHREYQSKYRGSGLIQLVLVCTSWNRREPDLDGCVMVADIRDSDITSPFQIEIRRDSGFLRIMTVLTIYPHQGNKTM